MIDTIQNLALYLRPTGEDQFQLRVVLFVKNHTPFEADFGLKREALANEPKLHQVMAIVEQHLSDIIAGRVQLEAEN